MEAIGHSIPALMALGHSLAMIQYVNGRELLKSRIQDGFSGNSYRFRMVNPLRFPMERHRKTTTVHGWKEDV